jgi:hypothetical protein
MGIPFASGIQMLYDGQLNYVRGGLECFLRVNNFAPVGDFIEVGVPYTPSGNNELSSGFVDILILPPPATQPLNKHDIGMSGGKLMFGGRKFFISNTFVQNMLQTYPNIKNSYNVFRRWDGTSNSAGEDNNEGTAYVQGIIYNNQLYSIEDIGRREIAGVTINWILTCNSLEEYLTGSAQQQDQP